VGATKPSDGKKKVWGRGATPCDALKEMAFTGWTDGKRGGCIGSKNGEKFRTEPKDSFITREDLRKGAKRKLDNQKNISEEKRK